MSINNKTRVTPSTPVTPIDIDHELNHEFNGFEPVRRLEAGGEDQEKIDVICDTTVWVQQFGSTGLLEEACITGDIRRSALNDVVSHPDVYRTPMYNPQTKTFIGAYWGDTNHFKGMLYFIEYNLSASIGSDLIYMPDLNVCSEFDS
jgi:hypothetical protein